MNVANLELCKELWELSGWESNGSYYFEGRLVSAITPFNRQPAKSFPAYDLGYLLRKLPHQLGGVTFDLLHHNNGHWVAHYLDHPSHLGEADTSEDATCKLAIELFKQGILTPTTNPTIGEE